MYLLRTVSGLTLGLCLALPVLSQSLAGLGGPAELPPGSFSGEQYVDSRGCVFIRAGYGGQETWVPRVSRDRQPLCGYQPTFGAGGGGTAVAEAPASRPTPIPQQQTGGDSLEVVIDMPQPTAPPAAPAPSDRARRHRRRCDATAAPRPATGASRRHLPGLARRGRAIHARQRRAVRPTREPSLCGRTDPTRAAMSAAGSRVAQLTPVVIPEGYRSAWDDGRLNAARGLANATPEGDAQIARYWTETVPREAVEVDPAADGVPVGSVGLRPGRDPLLLDPRYHRAGRRRGFAGRRACRCRGVTATSRLPAILNGATPMRRGRSCNGRAWRRSLAPLRRRWLWQLCRACRSVLRSAVALARTLVRAQGLGYSGAVTR